MNKAIVSIIKNVVIASAAIIAADQMYNIAGSNIVAGYRTGKEVYNQHKASKAK